MDWRVENRLPSLNRLRKDFDKAQCPFMTIESRKPRVAGTYVNTMKIMYSKSIVYTKWSKTEVKKHWCPTFKVLLFNVMFKVLSRTTANRGK